MKGLFNVFTIKGLIIRPSVREQANSGIPKVQMFSVNPLNKPIFAFSIRIKPLHIKSAEHKALQMVNC